MNSETAPYQLGSQTKLLWVSVAEWIKWSVLQDKCHRFDSRPALCSMQLSEHKLHLSLTNICDPPKGIGQLLLKLKVEGMLANTCFMLKKC